MSAVATELQPEVHRGFVSDSAVPFLLFRGRGKARSNYDAVTMVLDGWLADGAMEPRVVRALVDSGHDVVTLQQTHRVSLIAPNKARSQNVGAAAKEVSRITHKKFVHIIGYSIGSKAAIHAAAHAAKTTDAYHIRAVGSVAGIAFKEGPISVVDVGREVVGNFGRLSDHFGERAKLFARGLISIARNPVLSAEEAVTAVLGPNNAQVLQDLVDDNYVTATKIAYGDNDRIARPPRAGVTFNMYEGNHFEPIFNPDIITQMATDLYQ